MIAIGLIVSAFRPVHREEVAGLGEPRTTSGNASKPVSVAPPRFEAAGSATVNASASVMPMAIVKETDSTFEQTIDARSGGTLTLDFTRSGATVTITGWDREHVLVRGILGGRSWRETKTTIQPADGGVLLRNEYIGTAGNTSFSHSFDIRVPRSFNVRLRSAGGGLSVTGVNGSFTGMTGGGEIRFLNASGEADLQTGGGDISVINSSLKGSVRTGGGTVNINGGGKELAGISGTGEITNQVALLRHLNAAMSSLRNESGRLGPVETRLKEALKDSSHDTTGAYVLDSDPRKPFGETGIQRHRSGGDISLPEAPAGARVTTGGGAIRIGPSSGEVYATTGGGPVQIGPANGSVIASTGAGNISVAFRGPGFHTGDITSGLGSIELIVAADVNAELVLETAYTNNLGRRTTIESDWPLSLTETAGWDASVGTPRRYVRSRQVLGKGGGIIRVRTVNGNVLVRKAG